MPTINEAGLKLVQNFEGCRLTAYDDGTGVMTIGYGHTGGVYRGQTITQAEAIKFLEKDLESAERAVSQGLKTIVNPNQFSAMVSLCFNIGDSAFLGSSVLRETNQRNWEAAANAFLSWDDRGYPEQAGLDRRRQAERSLYLQDLPK